jgi:tetratricopeptide (TPR) repeat protein
MYEAWNSLGKRRVELARRALEISKDCADAYVLLAEEGARSLNEAKDLYEQGVKAGERALGPQAFKEYVGHFWGVLETRPYMRARLGLAQCLWMLGARQQAIEHYTDMLHLNPNDNQGIRYILANCLLEEGSDEALGKLLEQYEDDAAATWLYTRALWMFRQEGASEKANACLKEALEENRFVPSYLLGRKRLPKRLPEYIGFGDENEAIAYAAEAIKVWQKTEGALQWLRRNLSTA